MGENCNSSCAMDQTNRVADGQSLLGHTGWAASPEVSIKRLSLVSNQSCRNQRSSDMRPTYRTVFGLRHDRLHRHDRAEPAQQFNHDRRALDSRPPKGIERWLERIDVR